MTPTELKQARQSLGLSLSQLAILLGYQGNRANGIKQIQQMERGERTIREPQRRLMVAYISGYRPDDWPV